MKIHTLITLCISTLLLSACHTTTTTTTPATTATAAPPAQLSKKAFELAGTEVFSIASKETGNTYNITVALPGSYAQADKNKTYPVVYVLDAQWQYPLIYTTYGAVNYDGAMPEAIVVGVSWQDTNGNLMQLRDQDLMPTTTANAPQSGHAKKFQSFFRNELFPAIEKNYKGGKDRTLTGGSSSALFVFYTLLSQPDLFNGYIGSSPSLYWDNHVMDKILAEFPADAIKQKTRAWLAWGNLETNRDTENFAKKIAAKKFANLELGYAAVNNAGHASVNPECYTRGLQYIYAKPELQLSKHALAKLTGNYKATDENDLLNFSARDGNLLINFSDGASFTLSAASNNEFYLKGNAIDYKFTLNNQAQATSVIQYFRGNPREFIRQ